MNKEGCSQKRQ